MSQLETVRAIAGQILVGASPDASGAMHAHEGTIVGSWRLGRVKAGATGPYGGACGGAMIMASNGQFSVRILRESRAR